MIDTRLVTRGFSALLSLYPLRFRAEFGDEMEAVFSAQVRDQAASGPLPLAAICLREIPDLLVNLLREHLAEFARPSGLGKFFRGGSPSNLVWLGALVFGIAGGLSSIFGLLTGLSTTKFIDYSFWTLLAMFAIALGFNAAPAWIFWLGTGLRRNKWGFLPPAMGASLVSLLMLLFTILYVRSMPIDTWESWWFLGFTRSLLTTTLSGLVFGGLFGWVYQGRAAVLRFAIAGALGRVLGLILLQGSIALSYQVFHLNNDLVSYVTGNHWFYLWELFLVVISGMVFGAVLGWQASRRERRNPVDGITA